MPGQAGNPRTGPHTSSPTLNDLVVATLALLLVASGETAALGLGLGTALSCTEICMGESWESGRTTVAGELVWRSIAVEL